MEELRTYGKQVEGTGSAGTTTTPTTGTTAARMNTATTATNGATAAATGTTGTTTATASTGGSGAARLIAAGAATAGLIAAGAAARLLTGKPNASKTSTGRTITYGSTTATASAANTGGTSVVGVSTAPRATGSAGTHTIRRGETLADIARTYGLTLIELTTANPQVDPYVYRAGTTLSIPQTTQVSQLPCCDGRLYCVQPGDSVEAILAGFGITAEALLQANPILGQIGLIAGQILCIPDVPTEPNPCCDGTTQITVQAGQTVFDILLAYNISYRALQAGNPGVDLAALTAGQTLCVPSEGMRGTCVECAAAYLIGPGENLESIAQSTGASLEDLMRLNPTFLVADFTEGMMICLP